MKRSNARTLALSVAAALAIALVPAPAGAAVEITLDAQTLEKLLRAVVPPTVEVALPNGAPIALGLSNLRVTGFDPAGGRGHVLTALDVDVPLLGVHLPLQPRVSLDVAEKEGLKVCYLRFERMEIRLPMLGAVDVSALVPRVRVPADGSWLLDLSHADVEIRSRLVETRMGAQALRLRFDVDVAPAAR